MRGKSRKEVIKEIIENRRLIIERNLEILRQLEKELRRLENGN